MDGDKITRLKSVADLRDSGILTEDEFQEQKSRIMAEPARAFNQSQFSGEGEPPVEEGFRIVCYVISFFIPIIGIIIGLIHYGKPEPWHKEFGKMCLYISVGAVVFGFVLSLLFWGSLFASI